MGPDTQGRCNSTEEDHLEIVAERNVELRPDRDVHVHFGQTYLTRKVIRLLVGAEIESGAVTESVGNTAAVLETDLDANGIPDILDILDAIDPRIRLGIINPGGRTETEADLGGSADARHQERRKQNKGLFHGL